MVGGGPAGAAAAIAAARNGASVFLAEAMNCFGGLGTAGLVPAFMQSGDGVYDRLVSEAGVEFTFNTRLIALEHLQL